MQYILTQEEYDELVNVKSSIQLSATKKMQKLCTKIADTMPIKWGWGEPDPKPWGCIHTVEKGDEWYCDQCPVQEICPEPFKEWSQ